MGLKDLCYKRQLKHLCLFIILSWEKNKNKKETRFSEVNEFVTGEYNIF